MWVPIVTSWKAEVFEGATQASGASAFRTFGINFRANKR